MSLSKLYLEPLDNKCYYSYALTKICLKFIFVFTGNFKKILEFFKITIIFKKFNSGFSTIFFYTKFKIFDKLQHFSKFIVNEQPKILKNLLKISFLPTHKLNMLNPGISRVLIVSPIDLFLFKKAHFIKKEVIQTLACPCIMF